MAVEMSCSALQRLSHILSDIYDQELVFSSKQRCFNWLCALTDLFGFTLCLSWVFYEPKDHALDDAMQIIQTLWQFKLLFFVFPMIALASVVLAIADVALVISHKG